MVWCLHGVEGFFDVYWCVEVLDRWFTIKYHWYLLELLVSPIEAQKVFDLLKVLEHA
tara:strand:- start:569 stop:739 length:171 start_codon:yes stop_codon:yes gene_type:complete